MADQKEQDDLAADAFDDLRDEVAALRAVIEQLPKRFRVAKGPDYSPTLSGMHQTLERIERHPALLVTPQRYGAELLSSIEATRREFANDWQSAVHSVQETSDSLIRYAGRLRTREAQRKVLIYAAAGGLGAGAVLWAIVAGPIARAFPISWRVPEQMAAATLNLDRWAAGSRLMESADPRAWDSLVAASQLWRDNVKSLEACAMEAAKTAKSQACKVAVSPTVLPLSSRPAEARASRD